MLSLHTLSWWENPNMFRRETPSLRMYFILRSYNFKEKNHETCNFHTSPLFVRKTTSPWLPLRCRWPSFFGMRIGVTTSSDVTSIFRPKPLENSPCWNKLKGAWWHIEALKSCSRTGTPDVATAQQGRSTSMDPLTTVRSAPLPPTTYQ